MDLCHSKKGSPDIESGQVKVMRRRFLAAALGISMAVAMTPAAAFAEETSTEEATEVVSEVASEDETGAEEESSEAETEAFDYSEGYDEKGFFEGVKALDYVTLLVIPIWSCQMKSFHLMRLCRARLIRH